MSSSRSSYQALTWAGERRDPFLGSVGGRKEKLGAKKIIKCRQGEQDERTTEGLYLVTIIAKADRQVRKKYHMKNPKTC